MTLEPFAKPAGVPDPRATQFDHLALNLPDENALHDLRRRLTDAGCEVTDIIDHGSVRSVYFADPNGIALEASWWVRDVTGLADDYEDNQRFGDPDPVPALHELRTTGALTTTRAAVVIASTNVSLGADSMMSPCLLPL
jgi:catechol-2,3-dioxygenase